MKQRWKAFFATNNMTRLGLKQGQDNMTRLGLKQGQDIQTDSNISSPLECKLSS